MKTDDIDKIIADALENEHSGKRRRWHRPEQNERKEQEKRQRIMRWRNILNALFLLGFVVAILLYFTSPNDRTAFFCVGFGAMALKIVEFVLRFMF